MFAACGDEPVPPPPTARAEVGDAERVAENIFGKVGSPAEIMCEPVDDGRFDCTGDVPYEVGEPDDLGTYDYATCIATIRVWPTDVPEAWDHELANSDCPPWIDQLLAR